jgi:hypothetical protein
MGVCMVVPVHRRFSRNERACPMTHGYTDWSPYTNFIVASTFDARSTGGGVVMQRGSDGPLVDSRP